MSLTTFYHENIDTKDTIMRTARIIGPGDGYIDAENVLTGNR